MSFSLVLVFTLQIGSSTQGEKLMANGGQQHKADETTVDHFDEDDESSKEDEAKETGHGEHQQPTDFCCSNKSD